MNSIGATLTILIALAVVAAPRLWAAIGVFAGICYVTQGQQIYTLGFHFTAIRIVLLAAFVRCLLRREFKGLTINPIDKALVGYALSLFCIYTIRMASTQAFVYMLGVAYDVLLAYWVFRCLIRSLEEAREFIGRLAFLIVPFAALMLLESLTGHNVFRAMGGQGWEQDVIREGRLRCVCSFRGPHSAGIFGATMAPLFVALWFTNGRRMALVLGLAASAIVTFTSNSSGPLTAFVSGWIGLSFWRFRTDMKLVRRGIVATLLLLQLVMKAPVWFIFMKMGGLLGGDGYTRSYVIDQTIRHFSEWWLLGTQNTIRWSDPEAIGELDLTDQYVAAAITGGLLTLIFYILIFVRCYQGLGAAMRAVREHSPASEALLWCLGATLFAHVMALFTVGYFDQVQVYWWGLVAIISSVSSETVHHAESIHASNHMEEIPDEAKGLHKFQNHEPLFPPVR